MYIFKNKFSSENFIIEREKNKTAEMYMNMINESCGELDKEPLTALPFSLFRLHDEIGDRIQYENVYYVRRRKLISYVLKLWIDNDSSYVSKIEDILWAICDEYSWAVPGHLGGCLSKDVSPYVIDLFVAETGSAIAETLSLVGDKIADIVKKRCISEVFKRIIEPFETGDIDKYRLGWMNVKTNWSAVCAGSVGMASLYLIEDEKRLRSIIEKCISISNKFIDSCTSDGVCLEGLEYWCYAMDFYTSFNDLCEDRLGISIVLDKEKVRKISEYPLVACIDENRYLPFSDSWDGPPGLHFGTLSSFNKMFGTMLPGEEYFKSFLDFTGRFCSAVRIIAYFDSSLFGCGKNETDVFLPEAQWGIIQKNNAFFAVKGGNNDEPHNHNDIGSFIYMKNGQTLLFDLGAPLYDRDYFSDKRYSYFNACSKGHSVPIVNNSFQMPGKEYKADSFEKAENGISIQMKSAYDKKALLDKLERKFILKDSGELHIVDFFKFSDEKNSVVERLITKR